MRITLKYFFNPHVERHLITTEGEQIIDEVGKHWVVFVVPTTVAMSGSVCFLAMPLFGALFFIPAIAGFALAGWGMFKIHQAHMDRFVVTTTRVYRVFGVFNHSLATMPMGRILDVSVGQPFLGRMLGYGHFRFETAAQGLGLRDIRYVPEPEERDLTIQRVIQRAGYRKSAPTWQSGL